MAESEEEPKSLLMKVKEENEKAGTVSGHASTERAWRKKPREEGF